MKITREPPLIDPRIAERYPYEVVLADRTALTLTPMVPSDWEFMEQFLRDVPGEDQQFLRHDVTDAAIVERWCSELDYQHILPVLAWDGGRIAADGSLHQEPGLWTAHIGRIRLLVHPAYRGRGVGTRMVGHLLDVAQQLGLHKVVAECAGEQQELMSLLRHLEFEEAARLPEFVRDRSGGLHEMVLMVHSLR